MQPADVIQIQLRVTMFPKSLGTYAFSESHLEEIIFLACIRM